MSFKKNTIKSKNNIFSSFIGVIAISLVFVLWIIVIKNIDLITFDITSSAVNQNMTEKEKTAVKIKQEEKIEEIRESDKINILLVWRWWGYHDAPDLTDTIILASFDKEKHLISMLSIPRDLYVEYNDENNSEWKINGIYSKYYYSTQSKEKWMLALQDKITEITGEKIDYYINVDFNWFTKVIDALWGIEINIPENFVDDQYPDDNWWYRTLVFRKWTWNFNWENALKYARSRHSTSDFDRSLRQQQVLSWVKQKVIDADYLTSPTKIKQFYDIYNEYIFSDIGITDLLTFIPFFKEIENIKMMSYNVNDSCFYWSNTCQKWGFLYIPERALYNWQSVLLLEDTNKSNLSDYSWFQIYTNVIYNHQEFFIENFPINVFNSLKVNHLAGILSNDIVRYWFNIPEYNSIWNTATIYEKSVIYYNNIDEDSETIKYLKEFFDWDFIKTDNPKYSKTIDTKIEIIIWKDYLDNTTDIFKF